MKLKNIVSILLTTILVVSQIAMPVLGVATPDRSLGISPLRREVDISAGTSYSNTLSLKNSGKTSLTTRLSAEVFSVIDPEYNYSFNASADAASWVIFSPNIIILQPGQTQIVNYSISVPIGAEPGGRYLSLFATSSPGQDTSSVTTAERVASLVYVTIPGNVTRVGNLLALDSSFVIFSSGSWSASLQNSGSTHFRSIYSVTVKSLLDNTVGTTENNALILPVSVRLISGDIPLPQWAGIYKVIYIIGLGDTPAKTETKWMIYAPLSQVIPLGCIAGALILIFAARRNKHKTK